MQLEWKSLKVDFGIVTINCLLLQNQYYIKSALKQ
jgi:hypothetical protein